MTHRENLLTKAWTQAPLEIAGRPVILSPVRYAVLEQWENPLFTEKNKDASPILAMAEMLLVCTATHAEFKELMKLTPEARAQAVTDFMVENEDEVSAATAAGIEAKTEPIKAAMVESEAMGKGEEVQAHAS